MYWDDGLVADSQALENGLFFKGAAKTNLAQTLISDHLEGALVHQGCFKGKIF